MKLNNYNQSGQSVLETSLTIFVIIFVLFFLFQVAFYILVKLVITSAISEGIKTADRTGNPKLVDNVIKDKLSVLEIGGRKIFSSGFAVKYYLSNDPSDFDVEYKPYDGSDRNWQQDVTDKTWSMDKSDGYLKIEIEYENPLNLLTTNLLRNRIAEIGILTCDVSVNSNNYPFCLK